ncbi:MAG TPA: biotin/lipoyl-binding protein [Solirubrobacteraceae bacterium]|nr:biotin/lipoyl-binding protein [Solirubrobacteraceae bacterium]
MPKLKERPWLNFALALLCIAAIVVAYTTVGQASQGSAQGTRTATAQQGVVQSTVSGSGNIQAASQLNLGFKTSGSVTQIYVTEGQRVTKGKLLATLDPQSAEVTLEQAKASLQSAEANLAAQEAGEEQASSSQGSSATTAAPASTASVAAKGAAIAYIAANAPATTPTKPAPATTAPASTAPSPTTTPATTTPATTTAPATGKSPTSSKPATTTQKSETTASKTSGSSSGGASQSSGSSSSGSTISPATREANLASAKAAVKSDKLTVQSDEQAVQNTKLYAPQDGTIVSLAGEVGETVSATGTTKASAASSSSKSSSSTGATTSGSSPSSSTGSSSSSASSSSSSFAVLSNLGSMQLVVPLSESEIGNVKVGQTATVTIEALSGRKVAAHVLKVDALSTSNSGVVSYNVTFQLDQMESGLKVGMSATAEVVVKQADGVNVPTTAISAGSVTVVRGGKHLSQPVTTGLAGDSSTIILSGLKAGEEVVLPSTTSTTTSSSSKAAGARIGGLGAGGGLGGAGGGLGGAGGGAFLRGGPPGG